jgi:hypothetical protein
LSSLACAGLLVVATGRLAYALTVGLALVFVYLCSIVSLWAGLPLVSDRIRGGIAVILSSLFAAVYLLVLSLISPLLVQEVSFFVLLAPIVFIASGIVDRSIKDEVGAAVGRASIESGSILALLVAFALVREPLGYGSLSVPGSDGIIVVLGSGTAPVLAVRAVASSVGGLILTAYAVFAFRKLRAGASEESSEREGA